MKALLNLDLIEQVQAVRRGEGVSQPLRFINGKFQDLIDRAGFQGAPSWISEDVVHIFAPAASSEVEAVMVSLRGLQLVDPNKLSWETIVEFRKDKSSRDALRDLRIFFEDNFEGKSKEYTTDRLAQALDEQERVYRLWGFETVQKSLAVAVSNHSTISASLAGLAASVTGAPLAASAAVAAAIPLGGAVLEFGRVALETSRSRSVSPTRYLTLSKGLKRN